MGIQDDVFEVRVFIKDSKSKHKKAALESFEAIEERLWYWESENEKLISMITAVANGEKALDQIKKYYESMS